MARRLRFIPILLLTCALVMPMTASAAIFTPRAIDRYTSISMTPGLTAQKYLGNIVEIEYHPDGYYLMSDWDTDRVLKVDVDTGAVLGVIGSRGHGKGQFVDPTGIALGDGGDILVCDTNNDRIQVFTSAGAYKSTIGWSGNGDGELDGPWDIIRLNNTNKDYVVSERDNNRLQVFSGVDYSFVRKQLTGASPRGMDFDNNNVYVAEPGGGLVRFYAKSNLAPLGSIGAGSGDGLMTSPYDVAFDGGKLWVVDNFDPYVRWFTTGNAYINRFGGYPVNGNYWENTKLQSAVCIYVKPDLWATVADCSGIKQFDVPAFPSLPTPSTTRSQAKSGGMGQGQFASLNFLNIACWSAGAAERAVWTVDDLVGRIQKFTASSSGALTFVREINGAGSVTDVAMDGDGNVYLATGGKVKKYSKDGAPFGEWNSTNAQRIAVGNIDGARRVLVTDPGNGVAYAYDDVGSGGVPLITYGNQTVPLTPMTTNTILDVAVTNARVFLLDEAWPAVKSYEPTSGAWLDAFGTFEEFGETPKSIDSDWLGNVYVTLRESGRVLKYSGKGVFLGEIGSIGTGANELSRPSAVAVSPELDVFVGEAGARRIQVLRPNTQTSAKIIPGAVPAYNTPAEFSFRAYDKDGVPFGTSHTMTFRWAYSSAGPWSAPISTWGSGSGYLTPWKLTRRTYFRAYTPAQFGYQASYSPVVSIAPKVILGTPGAPTTMYTTRTYTIKGSLKPRHTAGTYPVRLYKYRRISGTWKSYGYVKARVANYSTYSVYSGAVRLPYRGTWKIVAYAPADSLHAATWSAPDYTTVR